jgi:hypothetical protein
MRTGFKGELFLSSMSLEQLLPCMRDSAIRAGFEDDDINVEKIRRLHHSRLYCGWYIQKGNHSIISPPAIHTSIFYASDLFTHQRRVQGQAALDKKQSSTKETVFEQLCEWSIYLKKINLCKEQWHRIYGGGSRISSYDLYLRAYSGQSVIARFSDTHIELLNGDVAVGYKEIPLYDIKTPLRPLVPLKGWRYSRYKALPSSALVP